jgi:hypothetical protein
MFCGQGHPAQKRAGLTEKRQESNPDIVGASPERSIRGKLATHGFFPPMQNLKGILNFS